MKKIFFASDHAGYSLKAHLVEYVAKQGHDATDLGPWDDSPLDYPVGARAVGEQVLAHAGSFGILICGTGIGMSMAANKMRGIRAAMATCEFHARMSRAHNNANILCLGERVIGKDLAAAIVDVFLTTDFEGGRHQRRLDLFADAG